MYKLFNLLFNFDYIVWKNSADEGIARVIKLCDGKIGYWRYRLIQVFDIIKNPDQVIWLTCHPNKYFNSSPPEGGEK